MHVGNGLRLCPNCFGCCRDHTCIAIARIRRHAFSEYSIRLILPLLQVKPKFPLNGSPYIGLLPFLAWGHYKEESEGGNEQNIRRHKGFRQVGNTTRYPSLCWLPVGLHRALASPVVRSRRELRFVRSALFLMV